jgi:TP901 family phage tail tape measure protein
MNDAANSVDQVRGRFDGMEKAGASLAKVGGVIALGVGLAVKAYADFDEQMSKVQAATHASAGEMDQLREAAIAAGADTSFSAKEAGQAIEELSKAGVSTADILSGGLDGALALAAAGSLNVADAAELAATAMTQFKLSGKDIPHVADLLAAGAGKAQGSVEDIGMALKQGGLVASSFGVSIDETVGSLAAFASAGLLGSDAGTSMKTMLLALANPSKESAAKMRELGINAYDASGNFVGMAKLAGNLQGALGNLSQEQRNAALAQIFGSDAIRTANVLYEQGQKGIEDWTGAVNDAGYAALTASINQNNLKGDLEKLTGSMDSVFLKSGKGMNDVLRGMVQGLEDVVDAVGSTPAPLLNLGLGLAGVTSAIALVSGGLLTAIPRVMEARAAWQSFAGSNTRLAGGLVTTAKVAGVAVAALAGLMILEAVTDSMRKAAPKVDTFNSALKDIRPESFNPAFQGLSADVKGVGDAFAKLSGDTLNVALGLAVSKIPGLRQNIADVKGAVDGLDSSMGNLVANGGLPKAATAFNLVAKEADASAKAQGRSGMSAQQVLDLMPEYKQALVDQVRELGGNAEAIDLVAVAQGKLPPALQAAAEKTGTLSEFQRIQKGISEEQAKALADVGLMADGTVIAMDKYVQALFRAGDAQLGQRDAARDYVAAFQAVDKAIAENGATLDINTAAGRNNEAAIDAVASAGMRQIGAMAANGASQKDLQGKLNDTYNDLIGVAGKFGITGDAADTLARQVLGIPKGVSIESWMSERAKQMAEATTGELNKIDGRVVRAYTELQTRHIELYEKRVADAGGNEPEGGGLYGSDRRAAGGPVYRSLGGSLPAYHAAGRMVRFVPNGTDTVPLMATPGEFVVKRSSARSIGYEQLAIANSTGRLPGGGGGDTNVTAYVQNPFTGEYLLAHIDDRADARVDAGFREASMRRRG